MAYAIDRNVITEDILQAGQIPAYTFTPTDDNTMNVECSMPNGQADELPQNDYFNGFGEGSQNFPENINFGVKIDENPEDVTWNIKNNYYGI